MQTHGELAPRPEDRPGDDIVSIVFDIFFLSRAYAERGSKEESAPPRPGSRRPAMFFAGGRYRQRRGNGQNYCATRWGSECDASYGHGQHRNTRMPLWLQRPTEICDRPPWSL